jgi:hypothetical protein
MNERIKKFMDGCFDVTVDHRRREECSTDYAGIEKFAQLIVRECIKMVEREAAQYEQPTWAVELVNDMYERFGVEP